jgi:hypothetical protein
MKTYFAIVGIFHLVLATLGMFGAIDYHLCVRAAGQCALKGEAK